ncbi:MAG: hypothetical protein JW797_04545 [Bradymonadales bacterium]|nr:hypothetical protein [Bradymonadales bacterium]
MSTRRRVGLYGYEGYEDLTYPSGHPFRPERARMLLDILRREGFLSRPEVEQRTASPAPRAVLERFHQVEYLDLLERAGRGEFSPEMLAYGIGSEDCPIFAGLFELASLAVGATLAGARALADKDLEVAFNPIGGFHHAGPAYAEGFCYLNDVVIACRELADRGLKVACLDLDVHHGNGTEEALIADPRVLTLSMHESGKTLYPWGGFETVLGVGPGTGYNVNLPLPEGTDDEQYQRVFDSIVMPLVDRFAPDLILFEMGMDVLNGDPLAHLRLTNNAIAEIAEELRKLDRPLLVLGGGGYHPANTARGWALALMVLCDAEPVDDFVGLVGGVFLGSEERSGGLRDMKLYAGGPDRDSLVAEVDRLIEFHREHLFPLFGL